MAKSLGFKPRYFEIRMHNTFEILYINYTCVYKLSHLWTIFNTGSKFEVQWVGYKQSPTDRDAYMVGGIQATNYDV